MELLLKIRGNLGSDPFFMFAPKTAGHAAKSGEEWDGIGRKKGCLRGQMFHFGEL